MRRRFSTYWRAARRFGLVAAALALAAGAVLPPGQAQAQEGKRLWSLRELLGLPSAKPREERRRQPQAERPRSPRQPARPSAKRKTERGETARTESARAERPQRERKRVAESERPVVVKAPPAPDKNPDARVILVVGDFLASGLGEGLTEAFRMDPSVRVEARSNGSSGLVRDDFHNWPGELPAMIDTLKPAAVVIALGANDRQAMRTESGRVQPRTDDWNSAYAERAAQLAKVVAERKVQLLWMGMPSFKQGRMSDDMIAFNDIYRKAVEASGGAFVDVWEGFVDENGAYVTTGPDINGQPARLRASDGINVTAAGKRKLAFYVERPLAKLYGIAPSNSVVTVPAAPGMPDATTVALPTSPGKPEAPKEAKPTDRTVPVSLNDPELDGGTELLGLKQPGTAAKPAGDAERTTARVPGRADDFSWTPPAAAAAAENPPATAVTERPPEQTSAIDR